MVERDVGERHEPDVEVGQPLRERSIGIASSQTVALGCIPMPEVDVDRHHVRVGMRVEHAFERRHQVQQLGVDEVLAAGVPADHEAVVAAAARRG